jgi:hypothetical protein
VFNKNEYDVYCTLCSLGHWLPHVTNNQTTVHLRAHRPQDAAAQQQTKANALFATLKEHLADVVDEVVNINNRQKVNNVIKKSDVEALKAQRMMTHGT